MPEEPEQKASLLYFCKILSLFFTFMDDIANSRGVFCISHSNCCSICSEWTDMVSPTQNYDPTTQKKK